jgi:hypothetical protein
MGLQPAAASLADGMAPNRHPVSTIQIIPNALLLQIVYSAGSAARRDDWRFYNIDRFAAPVATY